MNLVEVAPAILERASQPFPIALRTLDSLHLATALLWSQDEDSDLHFATHDRTLGLAARALGFPVLGL